MVKTGPNQYERIVSVEDDALNKFEMMWKVRTETYKPSLHDIMDKDYKCFQCSVVSVQEVKRKQKSQREQCWTLSLNTMNTHLAEASVLK